MKTFIAPILACLFLSGCASDEPAREKPMAGDVALDPVTGAEVRTDSAWKTRWNGNWYHFDSEENLRKFEFNPTAYGTGDGRRKELRRKVYPYEVR